MSQSRKASLAEAAVNILVGYSVNVGANFVILPAFGWDISAGQNLGLGLIYTVISLIRSYTLRRVFNRA